MSAGLLDHHRELLEARAIAPDVARERGYSSTMLPGWLRNVGFSAAVSELVPGLVIPVHDVHGSRHHYQYRPDRPRLRDGKPVKYETPARTRQVLDVPPQVLGKLASPDRPLWVTEGPLKADAGVSAGLVCIATFGVWGWRGTNHRAGKTALPDWEHIALQGREVYLVPDSDVAVNPNVARAVARLGAMLDRRGAAVWYVCLPPAADGGKTGLDDWLARSGRDISGLLELASDEPPVPPHAEGRTGDAGASAAPPASQVPVTSDPAALLDEVHGWLCGYVSFPTGHAAVAVTLWAVHTHLAAAFESTPRLAVLSPEKQCGKTRVLELLQLVCAGAEMLNDASPAYLFRRIGSEDAGPVTVLLDEADAIWKRGKADEGAEALRSIVNAGHRKGATVGRVEMLNGTARLIRFPVYAPVAAAAIGSLPDTITDRAVVVLMRRRAPGETVQPYRERVTRPEGRQLHDQLAAWAGSVAAKIGADDRWPDLPEGVTDRQADVWEPLLAVADLAGGHWPDLASAACTVLVNGTREEAQTSDTRLLADLRQVFGEAEALSTEMILGRLCALDEAPWGNWDEWHSKPLAARDLAKLLRPYGIKPQQIRLGENNRRGYTRAAFRDAWSRYLPPEGGSATSATSATPLIRHVADVALVADTPVGTTMPPSSGAASPADPARISRPQQKQLFVRLRELGMAERTTALTLISDLAGRQVESTYDLTGAEARQVLDGLQQAIDSQTQEGQRHDQ